jgi:NADH-quinone oxidoreductase subunit M
VSVVGLLLTAIFLLTLLQRVFHGPLEAKWSGFGELTLAEGLLVLPAVALMFVLGVWPQLVIGFINESVVLMVQHLGSS